jgi:hypothetical protein
MGGLGSGNRWRHGAHETTEAYREIDVRSWHREGLLRPGRAFRWRWWRHEEVVASIAIKSEEGRVLLTYRHRSEGGDWHPASYPVYLEWTACHLGGVRPWFRCPAVGCSRRVAILYGGEIFACRHCCRLAYRSQRESHDDRALRRANGIRQRLGWLPGVIHGHGRKPKGMHWHTYYRMTALHDVLVDISLAGMEERLSRAESLLRDFL